jgi:hypothetical protein
MRVTFESNHLGRSYPEGRLIVQISGVRARPAQVWFSVPPNFHTHNDCVAAALMTLVGRQYSEVTFNFAISRFCADTLGWYYGLDDIGPVDEGLEPRRTGKHLALNFSGGIDSTALWVLLHDLAGIEFKVVTTGYEGNQLDPAGYRAYRRDVFSQTNLRKLRYDRHGRFHCAVPLLYAEYADLGALASGHTFEHYPFSMERLHDGQPPAFLVQDAVLAAGGLREVHIARCLIEVGLAKILVEAAPERIAAALDASDFLGTRKRATKSLAMRYLFERAGRVPPPCLASIRLPAPASGRRFTSGLHFRTLWEAKHLGLEQAFQIEPRVLETDLSFMGALSLSFFERYNTSLTTLIPAAFRNPILHGLHAAGIGPYAERDFDELNALLDFIERDGNPRVSPSLVRG